MTQIYPVIHHLNAATSRDQAALALEFGADGVFLISHNGEDQAVLQVAAQLRHAWGSTTTASGALPFIGVNLLDTNNPAALEFAAQLRLDGVWMDAPGVNSNGPSPRAKKLAADDMAKYPGVTVFASVAFKYQPDEPNPAEAARAALALNMLPTTSGVATGEAPSVAKIAAMSQAVGGRLAVASGMTPENVSQYAPYLSHILVATGISKDEHHIDPELLGRFVGMVRQAQTV
jgi:predicted TIM-barrel enzyme